jgi:N-acetyl-alpha-D-muramate 1-phosphate uridylyltransferase
VIIRFSLQILKLFSDTANNIYQQPMKAMIFAAGLGTRLKPFTINSPKALAEVNGKSLLEHNVRYLQRFGIYELIINIHHFANKVVEAVYENDGYGSEITFSDETEMLLETGGGLIKAAHFFEKEPAFVVMNVDILTNLDLGKMIENHNHTDADATLAVMQRASSRQLLFDENMMLCGWTNIGKGEKRIVRHTDVANPFAFSGVQILSPAVLEFYPYIGKFSLIDMYLHEAPLLHINGYDHTGNLFIDVGKPGSVEQAEYLFS